MAASRVPDLADVLAARQRIAPHLQPTPVFRYPALDAVTGTHLWVKHENHQPVGAFEVRGGVNLVSQLSADERRRGVIAASTGNHGQSVAYAADLFDVRPVICMSQQANPVGASKPLRAVVRKCAMVRSFCKRSWMIWVPRRVLWTRLPTIVHQANIFRAKFRSPLKGSEWCEGWGVRDSWDKFA